MCMHYDLHIHLCMYMYLNYSASVILYWSQYNLLCMLSTEIEPLTHVISGNAERVFLGFGLFCTDNVNNHFISKILFVLHEVMSHAIVLTNLFLLLWGIPNKSCQYFSDE